MKKSVFALLAAAVLLAGCYHNVASQSAGSAPDVKNDEETSDQEFSIRNDTVVESAAVEIKSFKFSPVTVTVKPGQNITVINRDSVAHTMTSDDGTSFDSGLLDQDEEGSIVAPATPGTYPFHCTPHPYMKGTIVVKE